MCLANIWIGEHIYLPGKNNNNVTQLSISCLQCQMVYSVHRPTIVMRSLNEVEYVWRCLLGCCVLCILVEVYRHFRGACLHHQGDRMIGKLTSTRLHGATSQNTVMYLSILFWSVWGMQQSASGRRERQWSNLVSACEPPPSALKLI
jgi:hypothetical protein